MLDVHVPLEEVGEGLVSHEPLREVKHALRAHILQAISLSVVVEELPSGITLCIRLLKVQIVCVHVDGKHRLLVKVNHHERRVLLGVGSHRSADVGKHDWGARIGHALDDFVVAGVSVPVHCEPYDVLESLHQSSIPCTKLMLALVRRIV